MKALGLSRPARQTSDLRVAARKTRIWMAFGFVTSFAGSTLVLGSVTGFVALGVLPVVWVPVYRSLESLEDLAAPLVARLTRSVAPIRLLVSVEVFDLVATTVALIALFVDHSGTRIVFVVYLILVSLGPLILDIGEEYFANDLAQHTPSETLRLNAAVYSAIGLFSGLLSRPIGSLLAAGPVSLVLWINAGLTILGLIMRIRAVGFYRRATELGASASIDATESRGSSASNAEQRSPGRLTIKDVLLSPSSALLSPALSFMLALASGLIGTYLVLWLADGSTGWLAAGLVASGVGGTVGPQLARIARGDHDPRNYPAIIRLFGGAMLTGVIGVVGIALWSSRGSSFTVVSTCLLLAIYGAGASGFLVLLSSYRQATLNRFTFAKVIGWVHGASAAGALLGSWAGLALGAQHSPVSAGASAALVLSGVALIVEQADRQSRRLTSDRL